MDDASRNRTLASEKKDLIFYGTAGLLGVMPTFISLAPHPKWAAQVDAILHGVALYPR